MVSTRHPREADLTRAGNAAEALRAVMLADADPVEREIINGTLGDLAVRLRAAPWRSPSLRRAALRLATTLEGL